MQCTQRCCQASQAHALARAKQGPSLTGRLSPPVSSLAVMSPLGAPRNEADPMCQERALEELGRELDGAHGGAVARLIDGRPSAATARHGEEGTRFARARRCSRARKEGERWSGDGVPTGAKLSGELDRAPASNSGWLEPYHVERRRAQAARCGGGAARKMEGSTVSWDGRASEFRRGVARGGEGRRALWLLLLLIERERK